MCTWYSSRRSTSRSRNHRRRWPALGSTAARPASGVSASAGSSSRVPARTPARNAARDRTVGWSNRAARGMSIPSRSIQRARSSAAISESRPSSVRGRSGGTSSASARASAPAISRRRSSSSRDTRTSSGSARQSSPAVSPMEVPRRLAASTIPRIGGGTALGGRVRAMAATSRETSTGSTSSAVTASLKRSRPNVGSRAWIPARSRRCRAASPRRSTIPPPVHGPHTRACAARPAARRWRTSASTNALAAA